MNDKEKRTEELRAQLQGKLTAFESESRATAALVLLGMALLGVFYGLAGRWALGFVMDISYGTRLEAAAIGVIVMMAYGYFRALSRALAVGKLLKHMQGGTL